MVVLSLTDIYMLNYKPNISDASHRITPSLDGTSLIQATLADDPHWSIDGK